MNPSRRRSLLAGVCFLVAIALFTAWALLSRGEDVLPQPPRLIAGSETAVPTARGSFTRISGVGANEGDSTPTAAAAPLQPTAAPQATPTPAPYRVYLPYSPHGSLYGLEINPLDTPPPEPSETPVPAPPTLAPVDTPVDTPVVAPVATAIPTPTRGPVRLTKLGLGVYASGGGMLPVLDEARPSIILLMDPTIDFAQEVRRRFPKSFIVGRIFSADQPLDNPAQRGADFADRVAATAVPLKGVVDAWMSYNEVVSAEDIPGLINYNTFQVAFANRLQGNYGIDAVAANDGPRALPPEYYVQYYGQAIKVSRYFGLHIYPNADIKSLRDPNAADQVFFYRKIHAALEAAGIAAGPFIVTELGLYNGWRGVESDADMGNDFTWIADQMNADPYVLGALVFGVFRINDRWPKFEVDGSSIISIIGDYNTVH